MSSTILPGCQIRLWSLPNLPEKHVDLSNVELEIYRAEDSECLKGKLKQFSILGLSTSFVWLDLPTTSYLSQQQSQENLVYDIRLTEPVEATLHIDNELDFQHQADEASTLQMCCPMSGMKLSKDSKIEITIPKSPTIAGLCQQFFGAFGGFIKQETKGLVDLDLRCSMAQKPLHDMSITLTSHDLDSLEEAGRLAQDKSGELESQRTNINPARKIKHRESPRPANHHLRAMSTELSNTGRDAEAEQRLVDSYRKNQKLWEEISKPKDKTISQIAPTSLPPSSGNAFEQSRTRWVNFATSNGAITSAAKPAQATSSNNTTYAGASSSAHHSSTRANMDWTLSDSVPSNRSRNKRKPRALASMKPPTNFPFGEA